MSSSNDWMESLYEAYPWLRPSPTPTPPPPPPPPTDPTDPTEPTPEPSSEADKWGIRKIYPDHSTPQAIFMNMDDPDSDPLLRNEGNANLVKQSDGSWSATGTSDKAQVRLEWWQDPAIRDCEITVYANYMSDYGPEEPSSYAWQLYRGGGHHGTANNGCEGAAIKGRIRQDRGVTIVKEVKHSDYSSNRGQIKTLSKSPRGNYIGTKLVVYNLAKASSGRTPVKIEVWCDESGMNTSGVFNADNQNWQKYAETTDSGGWTAGDGDGCPAVELGNTGNRKGDEILNTPKGATAYPGNLAAYRSDMAKTKFKYFSFRKIKNPAGQS